MSAFYAAVEFKDVYNRLFEFSLEKHNLFAKLTEDVVETYMRYRSNNLIALFVR